jgi:hypothetical protein
LLTVPAGDDTPSLPDGNQQDLPVLAFEVSMHAQGLRLRRATATLAKSRRDVLPSPFNDKVGTRDG